MLSRYDDGKGGALYSVSPMVNPSTARVFGIVSVVLIASLGSIFLIGRMAGTANSPGPGPGPQPNPVALATPTEMATSGAEPATSGAEPATSGGPPTGDPSPNPAQSRTATGQPPRSPAPDEPEEDEPDTRPDRPRPARTADGPYGTRQTTGSSLVALTFDDGPDPRYTPQALDLLRRYQVKATFCVVGELVEQHPELVRAIAADGHTLCNHSWSHDFGLGSRPKSTIIADLVRTNQAIRAAVPDAPIHYFRQPGGNWTPQVVAAARQLGLTSLHWTVDPRDWEQPPPARISGQIIRETGPGAIVLLHDGGGNRQSTIKALAPILANLSPRLDLGELPNGPLPDLPPAPEPAVRDEESADGPSVSRTGP